MGLCRPQKCFPSTWSREETNQGGLETAPRVIPVPLASQQKRRCSQAQFVDSVLSVSSSCAHLHPGLVLISVYPYSRMVGATGQMIPGHCSVPFSDA